MKMSCQVSTSLYVEVDAKLCPRLCFLSWASPALPSPTQGQPAACSPHPSLRRHPSYASSSLVPPGPHQRCPSPHRAGLPLASRMAPALKTPVGPDGTHVESPAGAPPCGAGAPAKLSAAGESPGGRPCSGAALGCCYLQGGQRVSDRNVAAAAGRRARRKVSPPVGRALA